MKHVVNFTQDEAAKALVLYLIKEGVIVKETNDIVVSLEIDSNTKKITFSAEWDE